MKKILLVVWLLVFSSCDTECINKTDKYKVRNAPVTRLNELEQVKDIILRNLVLLEDSCCQNLVGSCNDPDTIRKKYLFPATKHLLNKYLPQEERTKLVVLDRLSPSKMRHSKDNVIISDLSFRSDSTILFPIYDLLCEGSVTEHTIIYSNKKDSFYTDPKVKVVRRQEINEKWSYYITTYQDEGW